MNTPNGRPQQRRSFAIYSIATVFVAIVAVLTLLQQERAMILSDVRAYVGGEGLYSKAQKRAVIQLLLYARSHSAARYREFEEALRVPLGDRDARLELLRPDPDLRRAAAAFMRGDNHPAEVDRMARFFLQFQKISYVAEAIRIWTAGDREIAILQGLGARLHDLIEKGAASPAALDAVVAQIAAADTRLTILEDEFSSTLADGARFLLAVTEKLLLALAAILLAVGWVYSLRVTAEGRRAEAALRDSEGRYRVLSESMLDGLLILREGRFLHINPAAQRLVGRPQEELLGTEFIHLIHPDFRALVAERHRRRMAGETLPARYDIKILDKSGAPVWVQIASERVDWGGKAAVLTIISDASERKRAEATLTESEERFRGLTDLFASYVWETDAELRFTMAQGRGLREIGLRPEDLIGRSRTEVPGAWVLQGVESADFDALREKHQPYRDVIVRHTMADGSYRYLSIWGEPRFDDEHRFLGYRGVTQDVTERVALQNEVKRLNESLEQRVAERTAELEHSNRELEAFNYSVAHDLRGPLGVIACFPAMIRSDFAAALPGQAQEYLTHIEQNAAQMGALIDSLLDFSRIRRMVPERLPVDMRAALDEVLAQLLPGGARVQVDIGDLPPAMGDPGLLRQVWHNLVGNALKFSRKLAAPRLEIGYDGSGGAYYVRDNGAGFDMQFAGRLFGVFERLHSKEEFAGSGIGLAIVKRIIERHGGRVWAEAAPGAGATFRFTLPA